MKQNILLAVVLSLVNSAAHSQVVRMINKDERILSVSAKITQQKNDASRVQLYKLYSNYFIENNIYPNPDAIDLVDSYNKQATFDDIQANKTEFKKLVLPPVAANKIQMRNQRSLMMKRNFVSINEQFKSAAGIFIQKLPSVINSGTMPASFTDSLKDFGNRILPGISNRADKIPALQMEFFLGSLRDINGYLDKLASAYDENIRSATKETMDDFYAYPLNIMKNFRPRHPGAGYREGNTLAAYAAYHLPEPELPDDTDLPNANVYVYTRGADGKWSKDPQPDAYNVYFGPNGLTYSLTPGCDTLSFFRFHPLEPASTLPVILPRGNVCFVLQDINHNNRLILKPDIRLRDNTEVDDRQLIKLCFKVEN